MIDNINIKTNKIMTKERFIYLMLCLLAFQTDVVFADEPDSVYLVAYTVGSDGKAGLQLAWSISKENV
jgi:hypothetical protein